MAEVAKDRGVGDHRGHIMKASPCDGQQLITLAQKLARDAERHAILSASLASQADRLMVAGLKILQTAPNPPPAARPEPRAPRL